MGGDSPPRKRAHRAADTEREQGEVVDEDANKTAPGSGNGNGNAHKDHGAVADDEEANSDDELEARRKKRAALLAKLKAQREQKQKEKEKGDNGEEEGKKEQEEGKKEQEQEQEQSKMVEEKKQPVHVPKGSPKAEDAFDMFSDKLAELSPSVIKRAAAAGPKSKILPASLANDVAAADVEDAEGMNLADNWDDAEGYYQFHNGETLAERYVVKEVLGRGVFSSVLRAEDIAQGNMPVALKIIRANDTMYKAGMKEIAVLEKLKTLDPTNKRHCVHMLDHFEFRNHLCLVFESLSMDLRHLLRKFGRNVGLSLTAVRSYTRQLLHGLKLMRQAEIMHADLKPDNILITHDNSVLKICDFGSAMWKEENDIAEYLVSRFYRAPEIILGLRYTHAIDMWAAGCCIYELYTGKILFPGRNNNQMLHQHMQVKGNFPSKMIRAAQLRHSHFDDAFNFLLHHTDPVTEKDVVKVTNIPQATRPFTKLFQAANEGRRLSSDESRQVAHLADLLEKMFALDPTRRISVEDALKHPFVRDRENTLKHPHVNQ